MSSPARNTQWFVWGGLVLVIATIIALFASSHLITAARPLPVISHISDFTLTNQDNQPVSLADLRGKVWVADIIFTRCPGPCPTMTHHLAELQAALPPGLPIRLVTFTSDPGFDTAAVLKKYAARFNADTGNWSFLTGPKKEIRELAVNDFKFTVVDKKPGDRTVPDDLFVHSTFYVLVDKQGQTRGWTDDDGSLHAYYDSADDAARAKILPAIKQLLSEN